MLDHSAQTCSVEVTINDDDDGTTIRSPTFYVNHSILQREVTLDVKKGADSTHLAKWCACRRLECELETVKGG